MTQARPVVREPIGADWLAGHFGRVGADFSDVEFRTDVVEDDGTLNYEAVGQDAGAAGAGAGCYYATGNPEITAACASFGAKAGAWLGEQAEKLEEWATSHPTDWSKQSLIYGATNPYPLTLKYAKDDDPQYMKRLLVLRGMADTTMKVASAVAKKTGVSVAQAYAAMNVQAPVGWSALLRRSRAGGYTIWERTEASQKALACYRIDGPSLVDAWPNPQCPNGPGEDRSNFLPKYTFPQAAPKSLLDKPNLPEALTLGDLLAQWYSPEAMPRAAYTEPPFWAQYGSAIDPYGSVTLNDAHFSRFRLEMNTSGAGFKVVLWSGVGDTIAEFMDWQQSIVADFTKDPSLSGKRGYLVYWVPQGIQALLQGSQSNFDAGVAAWGNSVTATASIARAMQKCRASASSGSSAAPVLVAVAGAAGLGALAWWLGWI